MLHAHREDLQCTVLGDYIYVGGNGKMERHNPNGVGNWENVDIGKNICRYSALVGYNECVFVIGGEAGYRIVKNVVKFCSSKSIWRTVNSMNVARAQASATAFGGQIFVAGGIQATGRQLSAFEMYDLAANSWTTLTRMISPRANFRLSVVDDQIFAVGNGWCCCSIETYDFQERKWLRHVNGPDMDHRKQIPVLHIPITLYSILAEPRLIPRAFKYVHCFGKEV